MRKFVFCAALACAGICAQARKYPNWLGVPGDWSDPSIWTAGVPADDDAVYLYPKASAFETEGATNTVRLTADTTIKMYQLWMADTTGGGLLPGSFALDGNGHTLAVPDSSGLYTHNNKFQVHTLLGQTFFKIESSNASTGWMTAADPYFLFHNDGKQATFTIARGNVTTPFATGLMSDNGGTVGKQGDYTVYKCLAGSYHVKFTGSNTVWHTESFAFRGNAETNIMTISDGAYVEVNGRFDGYGHCWSPRTVLNVDGGTLFSNGTSTPNGGWIEINHDSKQATWKNKSYELNVSNGALLLTTNCEIAIQGNTRVRMTDSTIRSGTHLSFGTGNSCTQDVYIARSTLSAGSLLFGCAYPGQKSQMTSRIEDTAITFGASLFIGCGDHTWRNVAVKGPYQSYSLSLPDCTSLTLYGTNTFSDFTLDLGGYTSYTPSGKASFAVRGGLTDITGVKMGAWFPAEIVVSDGTLRTTRYGQYGGTRNVVLCSGSRNSTVLLESGGTLVAMQLYGGTGATTRGGTGLAVIRGDGGTLKPGVTLDSTSYFLRYLDAVEATAKGLCLDSANSDYTASCPIVNASGAFGLFTKASPGVFTFLDSAITVSRFVVDEGGVTLGSGSSLSGTSLTLKDGTVFTCSGVSPDFADLSIANATLALAPADRATASGTLAFSGVHFAFTSAPEKDVAIDVLTATGARNTAAEAAWLAAVDGTTLTDDTYVKFSVEYDSAAGKTYYRATRVQAASPIAESGNTRWTGKLLWATGSNWEGGAAPTAANRALFDSETAGSPVTVSAGDTAGALRFAAGKGYTIAGSAALALAGEQGSLQIEVQKSTNVISAPLTLAARTAVSVDAGAKLQIGKVTGGSVTKTGDGRFSVTGPGSYASAPSISGGWNSVTGAGTLGSIANEIILGAGTLEIDASAAKNFSGTLTLAEKTDATKPIIFKNAGDVGMDAADATGGCLIKRGTGRLTLDFAPARTTTFPYGSGVKSLTYPASVELKFPDDGSAPVSYSSGAEVSDSYWGLNVHEGELVFKGTSSSVVSFGTAIIGLSAVADQTARTIFTVDGAHVDMGAGAVYVGQNAAFSPRTGEYYPRNPMLRIVNGGYLFTHAVKVGNGCWYASCDHPQPEVRVENGTLITASETVLSLPRAPSGGKGVWYSTNSTLRIRAPSIAGGIEAVFDSTDLTWWWYHDAYWVATSYCAGGTVEFRNGTRVFARYYRTTALQYDLTFIWDNARQMTEEDYTEPWSTGLTSTNSSLEHCSFEMRNKGMLLNVAEGKFFESAVRFWGTGGMTKTGPGTLKFTGNAYQFTGCLNLEGVLDLAEMTESVANPVLCGSGTVEGGTLVAPTIVRALDDARQPLSDDVLTLEGSTVTDQITVDLGHGADDPIEPRLDAPLALFRVTAKTKLPSKTEAKVVGVDGDTHSGNISLVGDTLYLMNIFQPGFIFILK